MEIKSQALVDVVEDVICDVCRSGTSIPGYGPQYGKLEAQWGYGSQHDGEHYRVDLCGVPAEFGKNRTLRFSGQS
jgi:hypothetical protein